MLDVQRKLPAGAGWMLTLFVLSMATAIALSYSAKNRRDKVHQLFVEMKERDRLQAEWGRLVLEHSTWTAHNRIEKLAVEQLGMQIPDPAAVRVVAP